MRYKGVINKNNKSITVPYTPEEEAEADAEDVIFLENRKTTEWLRKREDQYLPAKDYIEMLYKDMKNNTKNFVEHQDKVRTDNPKPL